jgi:hypothetical protein
MGSNAWSPDVVIPTTTETEASTLPNRPDHHKVEPDPEREAQIEQLLLEEKDFYIDSDGKVVVMPEGWHDNEELAITWFRKNWEESVRDGNDPFVNKVLGHLFARIDRLEGNAP